MTLADYAEKRDTRREQTDKANFRKRKKKLPLNYATVDTVGDGHEKRPLTRHYKVTVDTREHNYASKKTREKQEKTHAHPRARPLFRAKTREKRSRRRVGSLPLTCFDKI